MGGYGIIWTMFLSPLQDQSMNYTFAISLRVIEIARSGSRQRVSDYNFARAPGQMSLSSTIP